MKQSAGKHIRIPYKGVIAYRMGTYLHEHGPQREFDVISLFYKCALSDDQRARYEAAISSGWLARKDSVLSLGRFGRMHFEPDAAYEGQITPPPYRRSIFEAPPLSAKYIPNARGSRGIYFMTSGTVAEPLVHGATLRSAA